MKTRLTAFLILGGFALGTAAQEKENAEALTADDIIAKHLEASGGVEAMKKVTTRRMEGDMTLQGIADGRLTVTQKAPDMRHSRFEMNGSVAEEACDGTVAWKKDPGQPMRKLTGAELRDKLREARFYGFLDMLEQGEFSYQGQREIDGRSHHVVKGTFGSDTLWAGMSFLYFFDTGTFSMRRMEMADVGVAIEMSKPKKIDGISYPMKMEVSLGGEPFVTMAFDKITHGIEVDDTLFAMPEE